MADKRETLLRLRDLLQLDGETVAAPPRTATWTELQVVLRGMPVPAGRALLARVELACTRAWRAGHDCGREERSPRWTRASKATKGFSAK